MKILGIDPGLARTGWGFLECGNPDPIRSATFGCIETSLHSSFQDRLQFIYQELMELIQKFHPDALALEILYFAKHARTLALVGHARGICILCAAHNGIPVFEYAPKQVKLALTGTGAADKNQMQQMIQKRLRLVDPPQPDDAADALAIALCHSQTARLRTRLSALVKS